MHGVERRLGKGKRQPYQRVGEVVPMAGPEFDHPVAGDSPFVRESAASARWCGFETKRCSVWKRKTRRCGDTIDLSNVGNFAEAAERIEPACIRRKSSV